MGMSSDHEMSIMRYFLALHLAFKYLSSNGDFDFNTGLNVDDDLLNDLGGGVETSKGNSLDHDHLLKSPRD